ncbi:hypothetical protein F5890DRAFT_1502554 [Lentinula detonsa]|uniref:Uncharacterized protein n=1 Tax=Lentinula detonsa TaxID=2804962 RepID=A0AA38Q380_9AGAR|nr:hypothetical protein F5890DRAFT_1502554 [Lentinula detonsa]
MRFEMAELGRNVLLDTYYYVKLNCPGRSFHICKTGFLVPPIRRKGGFWLGPRQILCTSRSQTRIQSESIGTCVCQ